MPLEMSSKKIDTMHVCKINGSIIDKIQFDDSDVYLFLHGAEDQQNKFKVIPNIITSSLLQFLNREIDNSAINASTFEQFYKFKEISCELVYFYGINSSKMRMIKQDEYKLTCKSSISIKQILNVICPDSSKLSTLQVNIVFFFFFFLFFWVKFINVKIFFFLFYIKI